MYCYMGGWGGGLKWHEGALIIKYIYKKKLFDRILSYILLPVIIKCKLIETTIQNMDLYRGIFLHCREHSQKDIKNRISLY